MRADGSAPRRLEDAAPGAIRGHAVATDGERVAWFSTPTTVSVRPVADGAACVLDSDRDPAHALLAVAMTKDAVAWAREVEPSGRGPAEVRVAWASGRREGAGACDFAERGEVLVEASSLVDLVAKPGGGFLVASPEAIREVGVEAPIVAGRWGIGAVAVVGDALVFGERPEPNPGDLVVQALSLSAPGAPRDLATFSRGGVFDYGLVAVGDRLLVATTLERTSPRDVAGDPAILEVPLEVGAPSIVLRQSGAWPTRLAASASTLAFDDEESRGLFAMHLE
jgi:hypothetical protein